MRQYTGAPVLMHRDDVPLYHAMDMQAAFMGIATPELVNIDQLLKEGDTLQWGGFQASVMHTPGHTPGSVCLYLPKSIVSSKVNAGNQEASALVGVPNGTLAAPQLYAGDTLFAGSIGRTDLWGGSTEQIMNSLKSKVMELPDDTRVFPGHGTFTTILQERETNPFLKKHYAK